MDPIPIEALCSECNEHRATVKFCDDLMPGWAHGGFRYICLCCHVNIQKAHIVRAKKVLKELKDKLAESGCE